MEEKKKKQQKKREEGIFMLIFRRKSDRLNDYFKWPEEEQFQIVADISGAQRGFPSSTTYLFLHAMA